MGELARKYRQVLDRRSQQKGKGGDDEPELHPHEKNALAKLQAEAKAKGATLANGGKGGLPPSLVLGVFRRDKYACKRCGKQKDLSVHHKGGIVESKWLSKKGHKNDPNNISVICTKCHDAIHQEAKREGNDSSQKKPAGDDFKGQHGHD